jgi:hypothetical protein
MQEAKVGDVICKIVYCFNGTYTMDSKFVFRYNVLDIKKTYYVLQLEDSSKRLNKELLGVITSYGGSGEVRLKCYCLESELNHYTTLIGQRIVSTIDETVQAMQKRIESFKVEKESILDHQLVFQDLK